MFDLPLHPAIVHLPLGLAFVMPVAALFLVLRASDERRTAWLVVALQAVLVVGALASLRTGEGDEERVEQVVPEAAIEVHEERAELFLWLSVAVLAGFVVAAAVREPKVRQVAAGVSLAGALAVTGVGVAVGHAGGELVYTHGAAAAHTEAPSATASQRTHHEEDEDDD